MTFSGPTVVSGPGFCRQLSPASPRSGAACFPGWGHPAVCLDQYPRPPWLCNSRDPPAGHHPAAQHSLTPEEEHLYISKDSSGESQAQYSTHLCVIGNSGAVQRLSILVRWLIPPPLMLSHLLGQDSKNQPTLTNILPWHCKNHYLEHKLR